MRTTGFLGTMALVTAGVLIAGGGMLHARGAGLAADGTTPKPGIYLLAKDGEPTFIPMAITMDIQTSGVGKSMLSYGLAKPHQTAVHQGAHAALSVAEKAPAFLFRFGTPMTPQQAAADPMAAMGMMDAFPPMATSPKEFALVRLTVDGDQRKLEAGKNPTVKCTIEQVEPKVFKVVVAEPLEPGEYGFYFADARKGGGSGAQLWAFSIKAGS
jgi:hypothetical protein